MVTEERHQTTQTNKSVGRTNYALKRGAVLWDRIGVVIGRHAILIIVSAICLFPFYWLLTSSFKQLSDIVTREIQWWPENPTLDNIRQLLGFQESAALSGRNVNFARSLLNSVVVATIATIGTVFLSALMGFTFAKMQFRGRRPLFLLVLMTMMIPPSVGLVPTYVIATKLNWIDTWWPLIVPTLASAFGVFWMRQYISNVPDEMLDAARVDGCGPFRMFLEIVVPVILPGIAALSIFIFLTSWNNFLAPLIYLQSGEKYTMPLALALLNTTHGGEPVPLHLVFSASALSILPILIVFLMAQRYFIAGLTGGSTKG
jgi:ABC-type glycerol-3-phosphate transport system permease component